MLVVDGDMRKSYLHKMFGVSAKNGLSDILSGALDSKNSVRKTEIHNLYFMPRGETPINPSELLMSPNFEKLAKKLSDTFDLVIFDTPPILAVTDASIIGSYCNLNMMVSRFDLSSSKEVLAAKNRFDLNGVDISGVIFNAIERKTKSYYYDDIFSYSSALEGYYKTPIKNQSSN